MQQIHNERFITKWFVPIILFLCSYSIYSFNLEGQPWHGDEVNYLASGGVYFNLIVKGNFSSPCWNDFPKCGDLYYYNSWNLNHGPVRDFFVGLARTITGHTEGNYYKWSCFWAPNCWSNTAVPTPHEFADSRLFSPIFGSLSVVCAYFIGKIMFSRMSGLFFSLILLFNNMWLWNSRITMTEVYLGFFSLLMMLLLLYSLRNEKIQKKYFILSAVILGVLFNIKANAFYFLPFIIIIILLRIHSSIQFSNITNSISKRSVLWLVLFVAIAITSTIITNPGYWKNIMYPISSMITEGNHYSFFTTPSSKNDNLFRTLATIHSTLIPYFVNYYNLPSKDDNTLKLDVNSIHTYSSIPVIVFFIVGISYLVIRFKTKKTCYSEFLMTVLLVSIFILTSLTVKDFRMERYYIIFLFPVMMVSAYGLWRFLEHFNKKIQIAIIGSFLISHILTTMSSWQYIYFSPGIEWGNPIGVTLQESLKYQYVVISIIIFAVIFSITISYKVLKNTKIKKYY